MIKLEKKLQFLISLGLLFCVQFINSQHKKPTSITNWEITPKQQKHVTESQSPIAVPEITNDLALNFNNGDLVYRLGPERARSVSNADIKEMGPVYPVITDKSENIIKNQPVIDTYNSAVILLNI